jgi:hypothetical protein
MRENLIGRMLNDPSVHDWVKLEYRRSLKRDCVDAYEDAKLLTAVLRERLDEELHDAKVAYKLGF